MSSLRRMVEDREARTLSPHATRSQDHVGSRNRPEEPCNVRPAFAHDCHRIVHCKAFRRLRGKTQVFLWPHGDHYRTRLTHCMEVSQIARTMARAMDLNEDLAEAIALGHDLGHTPFGHAGEASLEKLVSKGFRHERQSLRVVEHLENEGAGLNLTAPVRDGILNHSKGTGPILDVPAVQLPKSLEGQLVRLADLIAYVNHDLDDAVRAKVLDPADLPDSVAEALGSSHSKRLSDLVEDVVAATDLDKEVRIKMSDRAADALSQTRKFLFDRVYYNEQVHCEFNKAAELIERLWGHFMADGERFYDEYWPTAIRDGDLEDDVRDFVAGMTDAYAVNLHEMTFTPRRWYVL